MLPKGVVFVVFCFLLRIVMAFGGAAADTASFAIVAGEFGSNIGVVTVNIWSIIKCSIYDFKWLIDLPSIWHGYSVDEFSGYSVEE